ncbi:hypothetical protein SI65_09824 [Aspergillus cristatus]|uniref:Uncharacterized protein n=1 Tax=Aspergillus cristatus TaxID=573508 RepID=A0A1E3B1J9_ASPCR|nr:hypothetical protein SI65_09824 [Aspergillus cristatus]
MNWTWKYTVPLRKLLLLFRTFFKRPGLVSSVQNLSLLSSTLSWICPTRNIIWRRESARFKDVVDKATYIIQCAQFDDAEDWKEALEGADLYAFAAVFIAQLPNIKSLCLDYSFVWLGGYPERMVTHALHSPGLALPAFKSLQLIDYWRNVPSMEEWVQDSNMDIPDEFPGSNKNDQFDGWFHLSSLQHLGIWLLNISRLKDMKKRETNLGRL